jgi:hypothetical protein
MNFTVADYAQAMARELREQPRRVRRQHIASVREHLGELDEQALSTIEPPQQYARSYRAEHGFGRGGALAPWRRLSRMIKAAIVLTVVISVLAAATTVYAARSRLVLNPFLFSPDRLHPLEMDHQPLGGTIATYREGGTVVFGYLVENSGLLPITLMTSEQLEEGLFRLVNVVDFTDCPGSYRPVDCPTRSLPLTLQPGDHLELGFRIELVLCNEQGPGTGVSMDSLPFRTRTLFREQSIDAPLNGTFAVRFDQPAAPTRAGRCPRPLSPSGPRG